MQMHFRLGEFFIGIITGYIMYKKEISEKIEKIMKQRKIILLICWFLSIGFFYFHIFKAPIYSLSPTFSAFYKSVDRELWACSICWIVFACHQLKSGWIVKSLLSLPAWQPLSKLTLSMYLLHMPYLYYTIEYYPTSYGFLHNCMVNFGDIMMSICLALAAYFFVEAPLAKLVNLLWNFPPQFSTFKIFNRKNLRSNFELTKINFN